MSRSKWSVRAEWEQKAFLDAAKLYEETNREALENLAEAFLHWVEWRKIYEPALGDLVGFDQACVMEELERFTVALQAIRRMAECIRKIN